jgi:membrane protein
MIRAIQSWLPVRVLAAFGASQASNYAGALAFACLMAMFPLLLGVLAIIGYSLRDPVTEARFQMLLIDTFPGSAHDELLNALQGVKQAAGWFGIISIGGLIWSATGIFASLEFAFAQILGIRQRDLVRQKLMGLVMMIVLVVAVGLSVAANSITSLLPSSLAGMLPISLAASLVIGAVVMVLLLVMLYRFVPNRSYRFRDVLPGAILSGVLVELLSLVFPLYERIAGGFNTYGAQFALFFVLAAWFYLLSNLILLGAVYNKFRLGEPARMGLIASPAAESRALKRPAEVIREQRHAHEEMQQGESPRPRPSIVQRAAGYVLVGLTLASGPVLRRRGRPTIKT